MEASELQAMLGESGALLQGHFCLSSGQHSDRYVQCAMLLQHPSRAGLVGAALGELWRDGRIDVVVGPALGGIVLAHEVARFLGVRSLFTERRDGQMRLRRGFCITPGERVLLVEDVVTTGGSVLEVARVVEESQAVSVGIGALIDRSGSASLQPELRALLRVEASTWEAADCPLCREGLELDRPGSRQAG